ncbi:MAG: hypothetical protein A2557_01825 [Candidatus Lambdaproteobacteria bacterium RIFOXYD2_FULL_56_26]|uniref:Uncharacterized protein n=1 Tax=Candidatus Lambdaproteobacteria bacterium RIFOXYD2_FULL_56_26 TaxID=1817773 RepID=A0A1F6GUH1_9PROT|nr:MAG: hypothetical protein A2426_11905 [Candidatus Lambdaproteobacteria bacterium RIFOXYC1_FULL_56_13]OGH01807.1 MAG: hypothetical protein A2557_01825 [Candidatus Lambdaproteobacteria bacterium RIFOXYD2_FULL_56_26]
MKLKGPALAIMAIFVLWNLLDLVIHVWILGADYTALVPLIRPVTEMPLWAINLVLVANDLAFVGLFLLLNAERSPKAAVRYGVLYGLNYGLTVGFGVYGAVPIPFKVALVWFLGSWVELALAGLLLAVALKKPNSATVPV